MNDYARGGGGSLPQGLGVADSPTFAGLTVTGAVIFSSTLTVTTSVSSPLYTSAANTAIAVSPGDNASATDTAGAALNLRSGKGRGAGAASSIVFQTPTLEASGTTLQSLATRFTVATASLTSTVPIVAPAGAVATKAIGIGSLTTGFYQTGNEVRLTNSSDDGIYFNVTFGAIHIGASANVYSFINTVGYYGTSGQVFAWTNSSVAANGTADTGFARVAAGVAEVNLGTAGGLGMLAWGSRVLPKTSNHSVAAAEKAAVYTNEGAVGEVNFTLPTAVAGYRYTFIVLATQNLRVTAASGDTIRIAGTASAAAGNIVNAVIGSAITIVSLNATQWVAEAAPNGTWTVT